jgi:hypothetical protein
MAQTSSRTRTRVIDARPFRKRRYEYVHSDEGKKMPLQGSEHRMGGGEGDEASGRKGRSDADGDGMSENCAFGSSELLRGELSRETNQIKMTQYMRLDPLKET